MPGLPTHLVKELNVSIVCRINVGEMLNSVLQIQCQHLSPALNAWAAQV